MATDTDTKSLEATQAERGISIDDVNEDEYLRIQTGFLPYWTPELRCKKCKKLLGEKEFACKEHPDEEKIGNRFLGTVITRRVQDEGIKDKEFIRFEVLAAASHTLNRGRKEDGQVADVPVGELFNVSNYATMPLADFYGYTVLVKTVNKRKVPNDPKKTIWEFDIRVDPKTKQMLDSRRREIALHAAESYQAKALQHVQGLPITPSTVRALPAVGETITVTGTST